MRGRRAAVICFLQRERRSTKCALGQHAADQPVGPAAAGAVVDLAVVVDRVVAARIRVECSATVLNRSQHGAFLRNHLPNQTSVESLGFKDDP